MKRKIILVVLCLAGLLGHADIVHVFEQTETDGQVVQISDRSLITGMPWTTQTTPAKNGYIFTHWTISTTQDFVTRDEWGRAFDVATFKLYEDTTLTAHYLSVSQDEDGDGLADGYEIYWYGNLNQGPTSDTDGDGFTFADELANGTNPLMSDADVEGPVCYVDSELLQYNPLNMPCCVFRSEPEGVLFATKSDIVKAGTYLTTETLGTFSSGTAKFAYWKVNGVAQRDEWGRAVDLVAFNMPTATVEVVAVTANDEETRQKLYWYGRTDVSMDSDTDGDGFTFAEELANGTNPLMADADVEGPVRYADGELLQYNPWNMHAYTIRSEPEGALFETVTEYVRAGMTVAPDVYSPNDSTFAYWTKNGVALRDEWGRALDSAVFQMPTDAVEVVAVSVTDAEMRQKLYWYGRTDVSMASDTDGDGMSFAEELANGTNPLMADVDVEGPVRYADSELHEVNLQPFEQVQGTIVDDEYVELFYSPFAGNAATSKTFDGAVTPVVVDLDGDERFDLVVESTSGKRTVYLNVGSAGNPQFAETPWNEAWLGKVTAAKVTSIEGLALDVQPVGANGYSFADVDGDGVQDLLVSDVEGRVWYYKGLMDGAPSTSGETPLPRYVLQHKVWGGSYDGFANGLTIAAVDWDEDGDVDLVCGTADGKLMLLNNPRIGRPVNVRAEPGATSVVLTWDPNVNSRVRGYGIYRGVDSNTYDQVQSLWPLPRYRDEPQTVRDYFYRVTGMSRFYTSGNSTPIVVESRPTDAVLVKFAPSVWLNDTSSFTETNVEMVVSINNSMGIATDGFGMTFAYDPAALEPIEVKTTGLTEGVEWNSSYTSGEDSASPLWTIRAMGGEIKPGSGAFLRLVYRVKPWCGLARTEVTLNAVSAKTLAGNPINFELPKIGVIEIAERKYDPAVMSVSVGSVKVDTCTEFEVPVTVIASEKVTNFVAKVSFDEEALELRGSGGGRIQTSGAETASLLTSLTIVGTGDDFVLKFYAKDQHTASATEIVLSEICARDIHGYAITAENAKGTVLIHDAHPLVPPVAPTMAMSALDVKAESGKPFVVNVGAESIGGLSEISFVLEWDSEYMSFVGCKESATVETLSANSRRFTFAATGTDNRYHLNFTAASISELKASSWAKVTAASATGVNGLAAQLETKLPITANVLIVREINKYDPGDINGDGLYTDADLELLNKYIAYQNLVKTLPASIRDVAIRQALANGSVVNLTGRALTAADVNQDKKVDANDISMLAQYIAAAKEAAK